MSRSFTNTAQEGKFDVWSIFLHEAGHSVGLDDTPSNVNDAIMYGKPRSNTTAYRTLRADDIKAVKSIYK